MLLKNTSVLLLVSGFFLFSVLLSFKILHTDSNTKLQIRYYFADRFLGAKARTLFTGSSTIARFPPLLAYECGEVSIRGFENGLISHVLSYLKQAPNNKWQTVVFYVGENDISYGSDLLTLNNSVQELITLAHEKSISQIAFVSIKNSPARAQFHSQFKAYNQSLFERIEADQKIDIVPLHELISIRDYASDGVHLNKDGYNKLAKDVNRFCNYAF